MQFPHGAAVTRHRRRTAVDPYSKQERPGGWADPLIITIGGAFVASSSSAAATDANRSQLTTTKSLYCPPAADVLAGDRIVADGVTYQVPAKPSADTNPFTGWRPVLEIPLTEVAG